MAIHVVAGGQYGSEGKGKLLSYLAWKATGETAMVRCGGSNAGHTAAAPGNRQVLRQLPSGVVANHCQLYLAAGMIVDLPQLRKEIQESGVDRRRIMIDRNAMIMASSDAVREQNEGLDERVGSTLSGTGVATARKVLRGCDVVLARDVPELRKMVGNVSHALNAALDRRATVFVEGTQGVGLSLHHSDHYPYVTSRDTTAAAFLSEAGLSPLLVSEVIVVLRTYPIRVAGHSGPVGKEISWQEVTRRSGYPHKICEYTTVTKRVRRVCEFDWELAAEAVSINRPTRLALHGADYLCYADYGKSDWEALSTTTRGFVESVENRLGVGVDYLFTGPEAAHMVDRSGSITQVRTVSMDSHMVAQTGS